MKKAIAIVMLAVMCLTIGACGQPDPYAEMPNPIATVTMKDGRTMRFELKFDEVRNTVANFTLLANDGFYDGLSFFKVIPGVLIQSGDPLNNGTGDAGHTIKGEFEANGIQNELSHVRGTLSMARKKDYNSGSSQFFIMQGTYPEYDGSYAAFGVAMDSETLDTIDSIASQPVDGYYSPLRSQIIDTIRVNTHGFDLEAVTTPISEE